METVLPKLLCAIMMITNYPKSVHISLFLLCYLLRDTKGREMRVHKQNIKGEQISKEKRRITWIDSQRRAERVNHECQNSRSAFIFVHMVFRFGRLTVWFRLFSPLREVPSSSFVFLFALGAIVYTRKADTSSHIYYCAPHLHRNSKTIIFWHYVNFSCTRFAHRDLTSFVRTYFL